MEKIIPITTRELRELREALTFGIITVPKIETTSRPTGFNRIFPAWQGPESKVIEKLVKKKLLKFAKEKEEKYDTGSMVWREFVLTQKGKKLIKEYNVKKLHYPED